MKRVSWVVLMLVGFLLSGCERTEKTDVWEFIPATKENPMFANYYGCGWLLNKTTGELIFVGEVKHKEGETKLRILLNRP